MLRFVSFCLLLLTIRETSGNSSTSAMFARPRIVSITDVSNPANGQCIGTMISQFYVLTGANCVENQREENQTQMKKIELLFLNENRAVTRYVDQISISNSKIALLHLSNPLDLPSSAPLVPTSFFTQRLLRSTSKSPLLIISTDLRAEEKHPRMMSRLANAIDRQDPICQQQTRSLDDEECYIINETDACTGMFLIFHQF